MFGLLFQSKFSLVDRAKWMVIGRRVANRRTRLGQLEERVLLCTSVFSIVLYNFTPHQQTATDG